MRTELVHKEICESTQTPGNSSKSTTPIIGILLLFKRTSECLMYDIRFFLLWSHKLIMPTCDKVVFFHVHRADNRFTPWLYLLHSHTLSPTYDNTPCLPPTHPVCGSSFHCSRLYLPEQVHTLYHTLSTAAVFWEVSWIQLKESLPMCFCLVINIWLLYHFLSGRKKREGGWKICW